MKPVFTREQWIIKNNHCIKKMNNTIRALDSDSHRTSASFLTWFIAGLIFWSAIILMLSGCSIITYEAKTDGSTIAKGYTLGTNSALSGARFKTDGKGARLMELDALNANQVEGLEQINQGMALIIEGAVKGAK